MSLADFLSSPSAPKRKAGDISADSNVDKLKGGVVSNACGASNAEPPQKATKQGAPDLRTPWNSGESSFQIKQHAKGWAQVEHLVGNSSYPWTSAAVVSSANTLRALSAREFDTQMKVHFRAADHPKLNEARTQEMHSFIAWLHTTADQMLDFVWDNRETLMQTWRDKSLKKSIDRAFKGEKDAAKAKLKWLDSEKLFRSYKQEWESTGPSICASRSFDAYGLSGKLDGENEIHLWLREKQDGKGIWTKLGGKEKGTDAEGSPGLWKGATYIPKGSVIMLRLRFQFFSSAVGYGVSLKMGKDIAILAQSVSTSIQADPDL